MMNQHKELKGNYLNHDLIDTTEKIEKENCTIGTRRIKKKKEEDTSVCEIILERIGHAYSTYFL
jgi:hypothetical protein